MISCSPRRFHGRHARATRPVHPSSSSRTHPLPSSLYFLTRAQRTRVHLCPKHWLLCHLGLYKAELKSVAPLSLLASAGGVEAVSKRSFLAFGVNPVVLTLAPSFGGGICSGFVFCTPPPKGGNIQDTKDGTPAPATFRSEEAELDKPILKFVWGAQLN
jgi:hypothetical protein